MLTYKSTKKSKKDTFVLVFLAFDYRWSKYLLDLWYFLGGTVFAYFVDVSLWLVGIVEYSTRIRLYYIR